MRVPDTVDGDARRGRDGVLLVGAFGQGNPGDEALCAAFCAALAGRRVVVASRDPDLTAATHGVESIPATGRAAAATIGRVGAVVVGGGTVFKTLHPSTGRSPGALLRNTAGLVAVARSAGARVAMIGVGAGDLHGPSTRALARWIVRRLDLLVVRDEESAAVLADAEVSGGSPLWVGADAAWTLPPPMLPARPGGEASITIALSHLAGGDDTVATLAAAIAPLTADFNVRLQPWQTGTNALDQDMSRSLQARLGGRAEIVAPPVDLDDATMRFAGDDLVIGGRFHALLAAGRAGTPFVAIAHEPKFAAIARRLDQVSVPAHATAEVIAATIEHGLDRPPPSAAAVRAEVQAASHSLDLMRLLLDEGATDAPHEVPALPLSNGGGSW